MAANPNPAVPVLSRGRHHWPSRRVCLMEYTAELAGEPRSDAPACTDPVLAIVARAVNDYSSDAGRQRLVGLAPALAAARRDDDRCYGIARRVVLTALPYAVGTRRFVLAAAVLGVDRADAGALSLDSEWALLNDADSLQAATDLAEAGRIGRREHARRGMPVAIEAAIALIAKEVPDADELLYRLLVQCLDDHGGAVRGRPAIPEQAVSVG